MDLAEAAALTRRPSPPRSGLGVANVGQPWDPVEAFEARCHGQFQALEAAAKRGGCRLKDHHLPPRAFGKSGMEHEVFHAAGGSLCLNPSGAKHPEAGRTDITPSQTCSGICENASGSEIISHSKRILLPAAVARPLPPSSNHDAGWGDCQRLAWSVARCRVELVLEALKRTVPSILPRGNCLVSLR
jgi:hypothetical protein